MTSFAKDIMPLFRSIDIEHMRALQVFLDNYAYMGDAGNDHENAKEVYRHLTGEKLRKMPPGGPYWSDSQLALYLKWMSEGYQP